MERTKDNLQPDMPQAEIEAGTLLRKKRKRSFKIVLGLFVIAAIISAIIFVHGHRCGDTLMWTYRKGSGTLTIFGIGDMWDNPLLYEPAEWWKQPYEIKSIIIKNGVRSIGERAFNCFQTAVSVQIPDSVESIAEGAFRDCFSLKSVTIPDNVTSIGADAFMYCNSITSIKIPEGVRIIERGAFSSCRSLNSVMIPLSVTHIELGAFMSCGALTDIIIPPGVQSIGENAFCDCTALRSVAILGSTEFIGKDAFSDCPNLAEFTVSAYNPYYKAEEGVLYTQDMHELVLYPPAKRGTSYTIPDGVLYICENAFAHSYDLTSLTIPASVCAIDDKAFIWFGPYTRPEAATDANGTEDYPMMIAADYQSSLRSITYEGTTEEWKKLSNCFDGQVICSDGIYQ